MVISGSTSLAASSEKTSVVFIEYTAHYGLRGEYGDPAQIDLLTLGASTTLKNIELGGPNLPTISGNLRDVRGVAGAAVVNRPGVAAFTDWIPVPPRCLRLTTRHTF